jgi:type IV secretion system protein VirB4
MRSLTSLRRRARDETPVATHVPFGAFVGPEQLRLRHNGELLASWRLDGIPFETAEQAYIRDRKVALHNFWNALGGGQCAVWAHKIRREVSVNIAGLPANAYARGFVNTYNRSLAKTGAEGNDGAPSHLVTQLYLTLIYRSDDARDKLGLRSWRGTTLAARLAAQREAQQMLEEYAARLMSSLRAYGPARLGVFQRDGQEYSEQAAFYGYLLNGVWDDIPYRDLPLSQTLPVSRLHFGDSNGMVEIHHPQLTRFAGMLDIQGYPRWSEPGMNNALLYSDYEYIESQSFSMLGKRDALSALTRQQGHLESAEDHSPEEVQQMNDALEAVNSGDIQMGEYHYSLAVFGDTPPQTARHMADAASALQDGPGFKMAVIDTIPECAWFAQLPGNWHLRPRQAIISSKNFTSLAPLHNFTHGKADGNPWGPALALMRTLSGELYYLNHHVSPELEDSLDKKRPGSTVVIGQTGVGKTALVCGLMLHALKYPQLRGLFIDKDRSSEICIRRAGGHYHSLLRGEPTGFNPFQLPLNEPNIAFCERFMRLLAGPAMPGQQSQEDDEISLAVRTVMSDAIPFELRRLGTTWQNLKARGGGNSLRDRLRKWTAPYALAWAFDNEVHTHHFDDPAVALHGYDYSSFIDDEQLRTPVIALLLHMGTSMIDGRPFIFWFEEAWKAMEDEYFSDFAHDEEKTIRKQNGLGVFITTSPSDILKHKISKTIVEQSVTQIYLSNPSADHDDYVLGFKLSEHEFNVVRNMGENSHQFLFKQGHHSVVLRYDLESMPEALNILSGSPDNVALLDEIRARVGDDPEVWEPLLQQKIEERRQRNSQQTRPTP